MGRHSYGAHSKLGGDGRHSSGGGGFAHIFSLELQLIHRGEGEVFYLKGTMNNRFYNTIFR